ncbi:NlpC/P60 family protein (plasmid) [Nocardia sp. NBC_01503]|uniref:NlpC/P60 family protein n=1 Tax=Nocardia sp. NBC_01503 TaxID=2975997 RepID=UPI002E7C3257|nr:NlpC/P60 family protein [Nocardia sp. NBC_01503]WTL36611.1 NlpC/P60 family protein [Nocardia sp. NBC_01503]
MPGDRVARPDPVRRNAAVNRVPPTAAEIGSRLTLDVQTDNPAAVRDELLALNAWLLKSAGFSVRQASAKANITKSAVSNYRGAASYKNLPESEPYARFLQIFLIDPGHVSLLVRRCEILKPRWDAYRKNEPPPPPPPPPPPLPQVVTVVWHPVEVGITVPTPGQLALKAATTLRHGGSKPLGKYIGAEVVCWAYQTGCGIDLPSSSHKQCELGALIHVSDLRPGDIVMLHSGQDTGLYDGEGSILTASVLGNEVLPVPVMQIQRFSDEHFPHCGQRVEWPSEPLNPLDRELETRDRARDELAEQFLDSAADTTTHSPGRFALAKIEQMSPYATFDGSQIDLVRAAFEAAGYTLPDLAFATPLLGGQLADLAVQVGDIVFTHGSGEVGLYAGGGDVMFRRIDGRLAMAVLKGNSDVAVRRALRPRDDSSTLEIADLKGDTGERIVIPELRNARQRGAATKFPVLDVDPVTAAKTVAMVEHTVKQVNDKITAPRPAARDTDSVQATAAGAASAANSEPISTSRRDSPPAAGTAVLAPEALEEMMVEGRVIAWSKKVGDKVSINEMLLVIRTPNIDLPVRALIAGTVTAIATTPGQSVAVGDVLCWIDETRPPARLFKRLFSR